MEDFIANSELKIFCCNKCRKDYFTKNPIKHEYNLTCNNCGKEFIRISSDKPSKNENHFCSLECMGFYKNKVGIGIKYNCKKCGKEFEQIHKRNFFCCKECKVKYNTEHSPTKKVLCSNCGEEIDRLRHLKQETYFCCVECESSFRENQANDIRNCEHCGEEFVCKKGETLRFCSMACQSLWQSETRSGKNSPSYNHNISDIERIINCKVCGKEIIRKPYEIKSNSVKYCCRKCMMRDVMTSMTSPHRKVFDFSENEKFLVENEHRIGRYWADIHFKNTNLVIEINGTYWHSDIRFYSSPKGKDRCDGVLKEKRKREYILSKNYKILYLWEYDINNSFEICKKLILEYIKNNGILDNYHSMNYEINNGELKLNDNILIPHAEL